MKRSSLIFIITIPVLLFSQNNNILVKSADYICSTCKNYKKSRLAMYTFTNDMGQETGVEKQ